MEPIKNVEQISDDIHKITFHNDEILHLIGTAHVSAESVKLVEETIRELTPDTIAVELDAQRLEVIKNRKKYEETDIIQIIKQKKVLFFIVQLLLSAYQKKIARKLGVNPGAEFKKAVELAEETGAKLVLADRNIGLTLKRVTRRLSLGSKLKFIISLFAGSKDDHAIDEDQIKSLKAKDNLTELIDEMGKTMPEFKKVILDERDTYLATKIYKGRGKNNVAVVGAAHVPGIIRCYENQAVSSRLKKLEYVPPASKISKVLPWLIPAAIIGIFIYGFFTGGMQQVGVSAIYWILINGILAAIGCALAFGHPLTILAAFVAAPITSLNPLIGAGMVVGLVQLFLVKPKVKDIEKAGDDITTFKGWWRNRLTRALLVSIFSSVASAIGTFVALPYVLNLVSTVS